VTSLDKNDLMVGSNDLLPRMKSPKIETDMREMVIRESCETTARFQNEISIVKTFSLTAEDRAVMDLSPSAENSMNSLRKERKKSFQNWAKYAL